MGIKQKALGLKGLRNIWKILGELFVGYLQTNNTSYSTILVFKKTLKFNGSVRGPYGFWEAHAAFSGPQINQSNCEFQSCYAMNESYSPTAGFNPIVY